MHVFGRCFCFFAGTMWTEICRKASAAEGVARSSTEEEARRRLVKLAGRRMNYGGAAARTDGPCLPGEETSTRLIKRIGKKQARSYQPNPDNAHGEGLQPVFMPSLIPLMKKRKRSEYVSVCALRELAWPCMGPEPHQLAASYDVVTSPGDDTYSAAYLHWTCYMLCLIWQCFMPHADRSTSRELSDSRISCRFNSSKHRDHEPGFHHEASRQHGLPSMPGQDGVRCVNGNLQILQRYEAEDGSLVVLDTIGLGDTEIDQDKATMPSSVTAPCCRIASMA